MANPYDTRPLPDEVNEAVRRILKHGNAAEIKKEGGNYVVVEIERHVRCREDYHQK